MKKVEEWGGIVNAVAEGKVQESVSHQAYEREKAIQEGMVPKVGVNIYTRDEEPRPVDFHPYDEKAALCQIEKLKKIKKNRNNDLVKDKLEQLRTDAKTGKNVMPAVIEAVKQYATVGEIIGVLKEEYGEFDEPIFF